MSGRAGEPPDVSSQRVLDQPAGPDTQCSAAEPADAQRPVLNPAALADLDGPHAVGVHSDQPAGVREGVGLIRSKLGSFGNRQAAEAHPGNLHLPGAGHLRSGAGHPEGAIAVLPVGQGHATSLEGAAVIHLDQPYASGLLGGGHPAALVHIRCSAGLNGQLAVPLAPDQQPVDAGQLGLIAAHADRPAGARHRGGQCHPGGDLAAGRDVQFSLAGGPDVDLRRVRKPTGAGAHHPNRALPLGLLGHPRDRGGVEQPLGGHGDLTDTAVADDQSLGRAERAARVHDRDPAQAVRMHTQIDPRTLQNGSTTQVKAPRALKAGFQEAIGFVQDHGHGGAQQIHGAAGTFDLTERRLSEVDRSALQDQAGCACAGDSDTQRLLTEQAQLSAGQVDCRRAILDGQQLASIIGVHGDGVAARKSKEHGPQGGRDGSPVVGLAIVPAIGIAPHRPRGGKRHHAVLAIRGEDQLAIHGQPAGCSRSGHVIDQNRVVEVDQREAVDALAGGHVPPLARDHHALGIPRKWELGLPHGPGRVAHVHDLEACPIGCNECGGSAENHVLSRAGGDVAGVAADVAGISDVQQVQARPGARQVSHIAVHRHPKWVAGLRDVLPSPGKDRRRRFGDVDCEQALVIVRHVGVVALHDHVPGSAAGGRLSNVGRVFSVVRIDHPQAGTPVRQACPARCDGDAPSELAGRNVAEPVRPGGVADIDRAHAPGTVRQEGHAGQHLDVRRLSARLRVAAQEGRGPRVGGIQHGETLLQVSDQSQLAGPGDLDRIPRRVVGPDDLGQGRIADVHNADAAPAVGYPGQIVLEHHVQRIGTRQAGAQHHRIGWIGHIDDLQPTEVVGGDVGQVARHRDAHGRPRQTH